MEYLTGLIFFAGVIVLAFLISLFVDLLMMAFKKPDMPRQSITVLFFRKIGVLPTSFILGIIWGGSWFAAFLVINWYILPIGIITHFFIYVLGAITAVALTVRIFETTNQLSKRNLLLLPSFSALIGTIIIEKALYYAIMSMPHVTKPF